MVNWTIKSCGMYHELELLWPLKQIPGTLRGKCQSDKSVFRNNFCSAPPSLIGKLRMYRSSQFCPVKCDTNLLSGCRSSFVKYLVQMTFEWPCKPLTLTIMRDHRNVAVATKFIGLLSFSINTAYEYYTLFF